MDKSLKLADTKRHDDQPTKDEHVIRTSLDSLDSGITIFDVDLRLIAANKKFLELRDIPARFGSPGSSFEDQIRFRAERGDYGPGDPEHIVRERVEQARQFESHCVERERSDGTILEIRGDPLPEGGFIAVYTDITQRKQTDAALLQKEYDLEQKVYELEQAKLQFEAHAADLAQMAEELSIEKDRAEAAHRAKSEFLAGASHELRTPLNAIIGFSKIIQTELSNADISDQVREFLAHIHEAGLHQLDLINDVLDLSKAESGKDELAEEPVELRDLVDSALRMVAGQAELNRIDLKEEIQESLPLLFADQTKLKQILGNLLSNAIKFTPEGGTVALKLWCSPESGCIFQVSDTGVGIAIDDIPKALSIFGQIDSEQARKHKGTGLGLPLSKSLVELHSGSLDLQSKIGLGTTVTVRFPAERIINGEITPGNGEITPG